MSNFKMFLKLPVCPGAKKISQSSERKDSIDRLKRASAFVEMNSCEKEPSTLRIQSWDRKHISLVYLSYRETIQDVTQEMERN